MRRYETILIVDPDISEEDRKTVFARVNEIIALHNGKLITEDLWGTKKLAYEINKKPRGYYVRFDYCGMGPLVDEVERYCRIDDRVMKFLTVLLSSEADYDKIKAEIEAARSAPLSEKTDSERPVSNNPLSDNYEDVEGSTNDDENTDEE
jgi:small subunit ribosomal protein S6